MICVQKRAPLSSMARCAPPPRSASTVDDAISPHNTTSDSTNTHTLSQMLRGLAKELVQARRPITPSQYAKLLKEPELPRIVPVDGSWFLNPAAQSNGKSGAEWFNEERIPGARFFDIAKVKDDQSPYPHMLPDKAKFDAEMSKLGIHNDDLVVVYDHIGNFSSPRVYWMLRAFQHYNSLILDNFPLYKQQGYPLDTEPAQATHEPTNYQSPGLDSSAVILYDQLREIVCDQAKLDKYNIIDARPADRFEGAVEEPRPGVASGHVPGAKSLPFGQLLNSDKSFKSDQEIRDLFQTKLDPSRETITMCGSGVTACILESALNQITDKKVQVYDGSWGEWGVRADPETMVIKGKEF